MPKLFPQDKANHYAYGSWIATAAAAAVMAVALGCGHAPGWLPAAAAAAGAFAALAAGVWKEAQDQVANDAAFAAGEPPPHEVSSADVLATALGAVPVAVPLLALSALALITT